MYKSIEELEKITETTKSFMETLQDAGASSSFIIEQGYAFSQLQLDDKMKEAQYMYYAATITRKAADKERHIAE
jgi:hypothetical protein